MKKNNNKGFTLIELIAVLVILAILALIVTPLVLNIVKKAKDSANKRSIDAYGKAVELSIATYLLDTGDFPTNINDLTIEYTGSEVICGIRQLNEDSSVYLSECTVGGTKVKDSSTYDGWYHYGKTNKIIYQSYSTGDQITYNGMKFYVIADSDENSDSVTMLKAEPLTVDEVNTYGSGHVNRYTSSSVGTSYNNNGYGAMAYYSSETCGYVNSSYVTTGCTTDYAQSEVKYVVDAWTADKFQSSDLSVDETGYSARLISLNDLITNLGYENKQDTIYPSTNGTTPDWVYNSNCHYWTMNQYGDFTYSMWSVNFNGTGSVGPRDVYNGVNDMVCPVVTLKKSAL